MWNLPESGIKPVSPALACRFLTTGPPQKSTVLPLTSWVSSKVQKFTEPQTPLWQVAKTLAPRIRDCCALHMSKSVTGTDFITTTIQSHQATVDQKLASRVHIPAGRMCYSAVCAWASRWFYCSPCQVLYLGLSDENQLSWDHSLPGSDQTKLSVCTGTKLPRRYHTGRLLEEGTD